MTTIVGKTYGKLTVLMRYSYSGLKNGECFVIVKCACGKICDKRHEWLRRGLIKTCGCNRARTERKHPLYNTWVHMRQRCYNPKYKQYKDWGGRGITVCDEWKNDYFAFYRWAMANGYAKGLEIDRSPDNNGNYQPDNCRFTTKTNNLRNSRNAKLSMTKATVIRKMSSIGYSEKELAKLYAVDRSTIKRVVEKRCWV